MGQSPGGGRMAVRKGASRSDWSSRRAYRQSSCWGALSLNSLRVILGQFFLGDLMSSGLVLITIVDVSVFVGATLYLVLSQAHLRPPFLVE